MFTKLIHHISLVPVLEKCTLRCNWHAWVHQSNLSISCLPDKTWTIFTTYTYNKEKGFVMLSHCGLLWGLFSTFLFFIVYISSCSWSLLMSSSMYERLTLFIIKKTCSLQCNITCMDKIRLLLKGGRRMWAIACFSLALHTSTHTISIHRNLTQAMLWAYLEGVPLQFFLVTYATICHINLSKKEVSDWSST